MKKRVISLLLALTMVGSLAACGNTKEESKESTVSSVVEESKTSEATESSEEVKEPVTITMYPRDAALTSGVVTGFVGDYLAEQGIILDVWAYSAEKFNAIMASGDLPDIIYIPKDADFQAIAESGMLLDLSDYMDQLPHIANSELMQTAMNYVNEFVTNGKTVLIPCDVSGDSSATALDVDRKCIKIKWDVYKELGYPEFSNLEEFIDVLKQMKEIDPETAEGDPTYGIHLFGDGDSSNFRGVEAVYGTTGHDTGHLDFMIESDVFNESFDYILDDDSVYKEALWFLNQLYREGLMDPDSINAQRLAQHARIEKGGALAGWVPVPGWEYSGYYPVYFDEFKSAYNTMGSDYGNGYYVGINAKSKNVETALKMIDILASPDDLLYIISGPEGDLWEFDANGVPVVTEKGINWWINGETAKLASGEEYVLWNAQFIHRGNTSYGVPCQMSSSKQIKELKAATETMEDWKAHYGYDNFMALLQDKNAVVTDSFDRNAKKFAASPSEEQNLTKAALLDAVVDGSWKAVYAETDADFEKIWADLVEECEGLGARELYEWRVAELEKAIEVRDSLK